MLKKRFYSICRYKDKTDGKTKYGYLQREGYDVPNNLGFDLAVYSSMDNPATSDQQRTETWFVIDTRTGLSVAQGASKNDVIDTALSNLEQMDMAWYREIVTKTEAAYGPCPMHKIMYNLIGD